MTISPISYRVQFKVIVSFVLAHEDSAVLSLVAHGEVELPAHLVHGGAAAVPESVRVTGIEASLLLDLVVAVSACQCGISALAAVGPRQLGGEPREGVVDGPGNDQVVVDDHQEGDEQHAVAQALGDGRHPAEHLEGALARVLAQGELEEEEWEAGDQEHGQVGDQEGHACKQRTF